MGDGVSGSEVLFGRRYLRYIIVPFTGVEVEVERAGEEDLNLNHVMNVPCLWQSGSINPPSAE